MGYRNTSKEVVWFIEGNSRVNGIMGEEGCLHGSGQISVLVDDDMDLYDVNCRFGLEWVGASLFRELTDEESDLFYDFTAEGSRMEDFILLPEKEEMDLSELGEKSIKEIVEEGLEKDEIEGILEHLDSVRTALENRSNNPKAPFREQSVISFSISRLELFKESLREVLEYEEVEEIAAKGKI